MATVWQAERYGRPRVGSTVVEVRLDDEGNRTRIEVPIPEVDSFALKPPIVALRTIESEAGDPITEITYTWDSSSEVMEPDVRSGFRVEGYHTAQCTIAGHPLHGTRVTWVSGETPPAWAMVPDAIIESPALPPDPGAFAARYQRTL